jgi:molybdopterin-binding protein
MMPNDLRVAIWSAGEPASGARSRGAAGRGGNVTLLKTIDHGAGEVMQLSARNQIPARVTGINAGEAIANVELEANGVRLVASITVEAVRQLGLAVGTEVTAVIKASDAIFAVG